MDVHVLGSVLDSSGRVVGIIRSREPLSVQLLSSMFVFTPVGSSSPPRGGVPDPAPISAALPQLVSEEPESYHVARPRPGGGGPGSIHRCEDPSPYIPASGVDARRGVLAAAHQAKLPLCRGVALGEGPRPAGRAPRHSPAGAASRFYGGSWSSAAMQLDAHGGCDGCDVFHVLELLGVESAASLVARYGADRCARVLRAAASKSGVRRPCGWVLRALCGGWDVDEF